tara:strand:+ start:26 stop:172 length:147 start_codon:yes stop_codon:yes gene_type:complete
MTKEQIKKRIKYLKSELAHEGYHDGWTLEGMKKELSKLEKDLDINGKI